MHFYSEDGSPRHFVPMAKDPKQTRPTRITDVRKAANAGDPWFPSVSTVLNVLDKPALKQWLVDQNLRAAFYMPFDDPAFLGSFEEYKREVKRRAELEMAKAPDAGTDIHDQLERWAGGDTDVERPDICEAVESLILDKTGVRLSEFACERRFVDRHHGYAGTIDLSHESGIKIDYKSKQLAAKFKPGKMAYPDHARQLAAYAEGDGGLLDGTLCANIFICLETGELDWHPWGGEELERGLATYLDALAVYHREVYNPLEYL